MQPVDKWKDSCYNAFISMRTFAFFALMVVYSFFGMATAMLLYHFRSYRLKNEHHQWIIFFFLAGSVVLMYLEFFFFGAADWDGILELIRNRSTTL